jgi:aspartokinase
MQGVIGMAGRIMMVLADAGVNVEMISQGPDEVCIAVVVATHSERKAVESLEKYFFPDREAE